MALVRICPNCDLPNLADQFVCRCGTSLILVPTILRPDSEAEASPIVLGDNSQGSEKAPDSQQSHNPDDTSSPPIAGTTRESFFGLRFPFGDVSVNGVLRIGRDPDYSPIASHIANLDKVSRRHAEVRVATNKITVVDNDSTNKVKVNGKEISPKDPFPLHVGDEVNFSSQLRAMVIDGGS